jgi:hypothetical protein
MCWRGCTLSVETCRKVSYDAVNAKSSGGGYARMRMQARPSSATHMEIKEWGQTWPSTPSRRGEGSDRPARPITLPRDNRDELRGVPPMQDFLRQVCAPIKFSTRARCSIVCEPRYWRNYLCIDQNRCFLFQINRLYVCLVFPRLQNFLNMFAGARQCFQ